MPDYPDGILADLKAAGWAVEVSESFTSRFIALGRKAGHTCVAESNSELDALVGLFNSVREIEAGRMFAVGMVIKLMEPVGNVRDGYFVIIAVDREVLQLRPVSEDRESGDMVCGKELHLLPMRDADRVKRTGVMLDA